LVLKNYWKGKQTNIGKYGHSPFQNYSRINRECGRTTCFRVIPSAFAPDSESQVQKLGENFRSQIYSLAGIKKIISGILQIYPKVNFGGFEFSI